MLTAFIRAFRTPDLRKKLLFTLFIIAVFRLGAALPDARRVGAGGPDLPEHRQATAACSSWSTCSAAARCRS